MSDRPQQSPESKTSGSSDSPNVGLLLLVVGFSLVFLAIGLLGVSTSMLPRNRGSYLESGDGSVMAAWVNTFGRTWPFTAEEFIPISLAAPGLVAVALSGIGWLVSRVRHVQQSVMTPLIGALIAIVVAPVASLAYLVIRRSTGAPASNYTADGYILPMIFLAVLAVLPVVGAVWFWRAARASERLKGRAPQRSQRPHRSRRTRTKRP